MPEARSQFTAPDGNIYGLGNIGEFYHGIYPCKMCVNQTWLDKLNIPVPNTTDEFRAMLEAFYNQDPNGNGKQDEVPLASNGTHIYTFLMMSKPDFENNVSESTLRRAVIYKTFANAIAAGDQNVHYIDGQLLFGSFSRFACTIDRCHPNDFGFLRMAERVYPVLHAALRRK